MNIRSSSPALLAPTLLALAGCAGEKEGVLQLPVNPPPTRSAYGTAPRPAADLTPEQGRRLANAIRANPALMDDLSMKERRFLARAVGALEEEKKAAQGR